MPILDKAASCLGKCEASLRDLAGEALVAADYAAVRHLTELAEAIAGMRGPLHTADGTAEATPEKDPDSAGDTSSSSAMKVAGRNIATRGKSRKRYPKFFRRGDKLVKVGWSKKGRKEYEHKAPRSVVEALIERLRANGKADRILRIDELPAILDAATQEEVPSYQVYLALAWLRHSGAVEKRGRDGYIIRPARLTDAALDADWERLSSKVS